MVAIPLPAFLARCQGTASRNTSKTAARRQDKHTNMRPLPAVAALLLLLYRAEHRRPLTSAHRVKTHLITAQHVKGQLQPQAQARGRHLQQGGAPAVSHCSAATEHD